jgi:DNA-directed RNA polymerase specialized sigma subunit
MSTEPKKNYLNNKDMLEEIKISKKKKQMTPKLAKMLMLLCDKYSKHRFFVGYSYIDDMRSFAMLMLVKTWSSFDPSKSSNPFSFYTQCIHNSFIQFLNQERKQRNIRDKILVDNGLNPSYTYTEAYNAALKEDSGEEKTEVEERIENLSNWGKSSASHRFGSEYDVDEDGEAYYNDMN